MGSLVRWGVVGPGGIAARFAEAMKMVPDGEIVAVASRSIERAGAYAARFGVPRCYGDPAGLAEDTDVDIVYVATPHTRHEADTLLFIEAGKAVLCEKPFALNARQARRMVAAARIRGVFLMEAIWSRFLPAYQVVTEALGEERIGDPLLVEADFGLRVPVMPQHRLFDPQLGGGALLDLGIYPLQLCSSVFGAPDDLVATGTVGETGVDEVVGAVLHHPGGGLGMVKAAIRVELACTARISGSDGWIGLPAMMHCPDAVVVGTPDQVEHIGAAFEGDGLRFQIAAVHRCLDEGMTESAVVPLEETIALATTMDRVREQVGVVYPAD